MVDKLCEHITGNVYVPPACVAGTIWVTSPKYDRILFGLLVDLVAVSGSAGGESFGNS